MKNKKQETGQVFILIFINFYMLLNQVVDGSIG